MPNHKQYQVWALTIKQNMGARAGGGGATLKGLEKAICQQILA